MRASNALLACCLLAALGAMAAPQGQALPRTRVVDAAAAALFASQGGALEAQPLDDGDDAVLPVPAGVVSLHPRIAAGTLPARRMVVVVDVQVDGRHWRTLPVWFVVRAWRPVWVARAPLAAGQVVDAAHFEREPRDVAALAAPALPLQQPLHGLRLRRPLDAGAVLTAALVEALPAVVRHQTVRVRVQAGPVLLQAPGVALADARIGERVRVLNPASRESFGARVVADGLVVAEEMSR